MARKSLSKVDWASSEFSKASSKKAATFAKNQAKKAIGSSGSTGSKAKRRSKADREVDDMATGIVALAVVGAAIATVLGNAKKKT